MLFCIHPPLAVKEITIQETDAKMKCTWNPIGFQQQQCAYKQKEQKLNKSEEKIHFRKRGQDIPAKKYQQENIKP